MDGNEIDLANVQSHFADDRFETNWPSAVLRFELASLMNPIQRYQEVETLLREVFRYDDPVAEFNRLNGQLWGQPRDQPWPSQRAWLRDLWRCSDSLPRPRKRGPFWSQRVRQTGERRPLDEARTIRRFGEMVEEFSALGYFANAFGQSCVDDDNYEIGELGKDPSAEIERLTGKGDLWPPLQQRYFTEEDLWDAIELGADLVARPRVRHYHDFADCGFHYSTYNRQTGFKLYRYRVNALLSESVYSMTLAESGRLEATSGSDLDRLVEDVRETRQGEDAVVVATRQFRLRSTPAETKRQAVVSLAGVLEQRRQQLKQELFSKDEGALFLIANEFDIRHRGGNQKSDYDQSLFLEWIFYWYLSTIHLTDQLLARQAEKPGGSISDETPF